MVDNLIKNVNISRKDGFYLNDYQKLSQTLAKLEKKRKKLYYLVLVMLY